MSLIDAGDRRSWFVMGNNISAAGGNHQTFMAFDIDTKTWRTLDDLPWVRESAAACLVGQKIFAIGGTKKDVVSGDIDEYNLNAETWREPAKLEVPRTGAACVYDGENIFVLGGKVDGTTNIDVVHKYNPISKQIEGRASMRIGRSFFAACAVTHGDKKYIVIAGGSGAGGSIEMYDILTDVWAPVGQVMDKHRSGTGGALAANGFYIIGGQLKPADVGLKTVVIVIVIVI